MGVSILETGTTIRLMELASTNGKTVESTMEVGKIMTWMAWVFIFIRMESLMKASTKMTRKQDMVSTTGQMVVNMKAGGTKASNMALVFIKTPPKTR